jgi:hypothetical protein
LYEAKTDYKGKIENIKRVVKRNRKKVAVKKKGKKKGGQNYSNVRKTGKQNDRNTSDPSGSIIF